MADDRSLLEEFKPFLRYDSNEGYFADSAAEMTDAAGNVLLSAEGATIAKAGPGEHDLRLGFLAAPGGNYANGAPVTAGDRLSIPTRDYSDQYRAIRAKPGYANVVYGRVAEADGVTWLQYWLWYFYNDLRALAIGLGLHEGDWEGIQLRMDGGEPDLAVYAQHAYAEAREWSRVERHGRRPVVYVAQGSHGSYFDDGLPLTHWHFTEHFIDRTDGKVTPKGDVSLEVLPEPAPGWALWPGRWGDTEQPTEGPKPYREISSGSPTGPGRKKHWTDPGWLLRKAEEVGRAPGATARRPPAVPPTPSRPKLAPQRKDKRLQLAYDVAPAAGEQRPSHLLVTMNSPDDPFPPKTFRFELGADSGAVEVPFDVDPNHRYELRASGLTPDGALSESVPAEVPPAKGQGPVTTQRLTFRSGSLACRGWLTPPQGVAPPWPAVVLAHGLSATHAFHYWRVGERLAANGFAVLDFDPRHVGASEGEPRQALRPRRQVEDIGAAVAYLRGRDDVDPARIAVWGSSLGGGLAMDAAAADSGGHIAAVVAVVPQVDGLTNLPGAQLGKRLRFMAAGAIDALGRLAGGPPLLVQAFGPEPTPRAVLDRDNAWHAVTEEMHPGGRWVRPGVYEAEESSFRNEVPARDVLGAALYRPIRRTRRIRCPLLMIIASKDTITPPAPQRKAAAQAGATLVELPCRHFDPFRAAAQLPEVIARSAEFLGAHLV